MIDIFCLFTPCFVCLMWTLLLLMRRHNTSLRMLTCMSIMSGIYFFFDAHFYYDKVDFHVLTRIDWICSLLVMALIPMAGIYLHSYVWEKFRKRELLFFLPGLIYNLIMLAFYIKLGNKNVGNILDTYYSTGEIPHSYMPKEFLYFWHNVYEMVLFGELLGLLVYLAWFMKHVQFSFKRFMDFFFRKGTSHIPTMSATMMITFVLLIAVRMILGPEFMREYQFLSCLFSLAIAFVLYIVFYVGYVGDRHEPTLHSLTSLDLMSDLVTNTIDYVRDVNVKVGEERRGQDLFLVDDARELIELTKQMEEEMKHNEK